MMDNKEPRKGREEGRIGNYEEMKPKHTAW